jgi:DNA-binding MarR family transcriptional regulator
MERRSREPRFRVEPEFERTYPRSSALATECVINMGFLADRFGAYVENLVRSCGIPSTAAFNALEIVRGAGEPLAPSTIAARMIVSRGTMTGILDSLERRGLVRRARHGSDGRMRLVEVTAEGSARAQRVLPRLHEAEKRWLDWLSEREQRQLLRLVAALQAHLPTNPDGVEAHR